jgi:hypothetical protein
MVKLPTDQLLIIQAARKRQPFLGKSLHLYIVASSGCNRRKEVEQCANLESMTGLTGQCQPFLEKRFSPGKVSALNLKGS